MSSAFYSHRRRSSSRCGGASVLLYTTHPKTHELYLVLGRDAFGKQKWSDFGGGAKHEKDFRCAARELKEETHGIFPNITVDHLRTLAKIVFKFPHATKPGNVMHYSTFMCRVPFPKEEDDSLGAKFRAAFRKLPERIKKQVHVAEKEEIDLVRARDLDTTELRSFFRMRMQYLLPLIRGPQDPFGRKIVHLYTRRTHKKKKDGQKDKKCNDHTLDHAVDHTLEHATQSSSGSDTQSDDEQSDSSSTTTGLTTSTSDSSSPATLPELKTATGQKGKRRVKRNYGFRNRWKYKSKRIDWSRKVSCTHPPLPKGLANRVRGDSRVWRAPRNKQHEASEAREVTQPRALRDFPVALAVV